MGMGMGMDMGMGMGMLHCFVIKLDIKFVFFVCFIFLCAWVLRGVTNVPPIPPILIRRTMYITLDGVHISQYRKLSESSVYHPRWGSYIAV